MFWTEVCPNEPVKLTDTISGNVIEVVIVFKSSGHLTLGVDAPQSVKIEKKNRNKSIRRDPNDTSEQF